jgi:uncharacterized protein YjbI with pentapeptide repeats
MAKHSSINSTWADHSKRVQGMLRWGCLIGSLVAVLLLPTACADYIVHSRQEAVDALPLLDMMIPENLTLPSKDLREIVWYDPMGVGTRWLMQNCGSIVDARSIFEELCELGWPPPQGVTERVHWPHPTYGGTGDNRYCASAAREGIAEPGYLPPYPTGEIDSYVIFQKGSVLISIYEMTKDKQQVGKLTNETIRDLAAKLASVARTRMGARDQMVWEITNLGGMGRDLRGADLSGADLKDTWLLDANLSHANLNGADLSRSLLEYANLGMADLRKANLRDAYLFQASLSEANLSHADLQNAHLTSANLSAADLSHADLQSVYLVASNLQGATLRGANLNGASLLDADLRGANLRDATLRGAKLWWTPPKMRADLRGADLTNADLTGAEVTAEQLAEAASLKGTIMPDGSRHE